jgi:hypothetical protein
MKKIISVLALASSLLVCSNAYALNTCKDDWKFRQDKQLHFAGSVAMAGIGSLILDDPMKSFIYSSAIGAVYEVSTGCASIQDFGYDVLGSALGAYLGYKVKNFIITPNRIVYSVNFN